MNESKCIFYAKNSESTLNRCIHKKTFNDCCNNKNCGLSEHTKNKKIIARKDEI